jgi:hypothetical protein
MNEIRFVYLDKYFYDVCERPVPSSTYIPDWFKDLPPYLYGDNKLSLTPESKFASNVSAKKCIPMLDAITTGYTITLWSDVIVEQPESGQPQISWEVARPVFATHGTSSELVGPPPGFDNVVFKYLTSFRIETPRGYSVMVRPPAGHYDLPFQVIPAIVDTDRSVIDSNFPLWVRSGFQGVVEKGTPIAQVIPFKRDNWKSSFSWIDEKDFIAQEDRGFNSTIKNNYIKNIWSKKTFK